MSVPVGQPILMQTSIHGSSKYLSPTPAGFVAAAQFYDFAPAPCICCACLVPEAQQKRMYAHVYENRVEFNHALSPCLCCGVHENMIIDLIQVRHLDRLPSRAGMCCCCVPFTCCGPPVIFAYKPHLLCIDCSDNFGVQIRAAPCNCFGLKECLCCCQPCYTRCSLPLITGVKNPEQFLSAWKFAVDSCARVTPPLSACRPSRDLATCASTTHCLPRLPPLCLPTDSEERGVPRGEMAIFEAVNDNVFDTGAVSGIRSPQMAAKLGVNPEMERP